MEPLDGPLRTIQLAETYWRIFWLRLSGCLTLRVSGHRKDLYFRHGEPFLAKSSFPAESLARFLLDRKLVDTERLDRATVLTTKEAQTLQQALLASEAIRRNVLDAALVERERDAFLTAFRLSDANIAFERDPLGRPPRSSPRSDVFALVREGVQRYLDVERVMRELEPLSSSPLVRTAAFPRVLREVRLTTEERRVAHGCDGKRRIADLIGMTGGDPARVLPTVYLLRAVGLVRGSAEPEPDLDRPTALDDLPPSPRATLLEEMLALPDPPLRERVVPPSPPARPAWQPRARKTGRQPWDTAVLDVTGAPREGSDAPSLDEKEVAAVLARDGYQVVRTIGRGGWGVVLQAHQERLERMVAVKVMSPMGADKSYQERFVREARSAARLNHAGIVTVYDSNSKDGVHYLVMELMDGQTLSDRVNASGPLPEKEALVLVTLAGALEHAHARSILHRDVKPENVFYGHDGRVKLGDWGLAKPVTSSDVNVTQTGWVVGTPNFIAPEQLKGLREIDHRADLYALGATLYFMLTGHPPFEGPSVVDVLASHLLEPPPDPRGIVESVSGGSAALTIRCMAKEPSNRPADAHEIQEEALRILRSLPS